MDIVSLGRARGWFTVPEVAALTGYTARSLHTMKSAERGFMARAWRAADRRVRVPYADVMDFVESTRKEVA